MTKIGNKANFAQQLKDERERLIAAIERKIAEEIAKTDADNSQEVRAKFSRDALRNSIQLVVALGEAQCFWFCFWREGHGEANAYDEKDFPGIRDCTHDTDDKEVAKILGLSDSTLLYAEKVERQWIINTTYSDTAAEPVAYNLIKMHKQSKEREKQDAKKKSQIKQITDLLRQFGVWVSFLTLALAVFLSPIGLDNLAAAFAFLWAALVFALAALIAQSITRSLKVGVSFLIVAAAIGVGYFLWRASQPHFAITAFDTLKSDPNAYELTDMLIWNQNNLDEYGVGITFTLQIRPIYYGKQQFGQVIVLIAGDSDNPPLEKPLWSDFRAGVSTQQIQLTLPELLRASGLKTNSNPPNNIFSSGDLPFQQAKLTVRVVPAGDKTHTWDSTEIAIRNAPWEIRSSLVSRNGRREADVYVKNLGGAGEFTVRYHLARIEELTGPSTTIEAWNEPRELVYLKRGEFFTNTVPLPSGLAQGRYLLEIYAVKRQNFVQFEDTSATWENLNSLDSPWWFGRYPTDILNFVETFELLLDATIKAEWERLRDEQDIDLGLAIGPVEDVTSGTGTVGLQQEFQKGEIYVHNGQSYALYGPILEHYKDLGGVQYEKLGFPISRIQNVISSSGTEGMMMEFEGPGDPNPSTVIYASSKGVATIREWIGWVYPKDENGHEGWLGFPLADEKQFADSRVQVFEHGYIVYPQPYVGGERDYRRPIAYPYLASRGTLFDVQADQPWQDTGVQIQSGDRATIVQVDGAWTEWESGQEPYDANGNVDVGPQEGAELPSVAVGALIGRIGGDDGYLFPVGRWGVLVFPVQGTLYLAMNDHRYEDNAGFITVQIMVEPSE